MTPATADRSLQPVYAIGGVGGSGTRLVAELLAQLGYDPGKPLNAERDNLAFTLLFKRLDMLEAGDADFADCLQVFLAGSFGEAAPVNYRTIIEQAQQAHPPVWSQPVVEYLMTACLAASDTQAATTDRKPIGWKEPNTHLFIARLYQHLPGLRYIHVIRNGLDMAYSTNQRQALLWGRHLLGYGCDTPDPVYLLKYWCEANKRMAYFRDTWADTRPIFWLDYDALVSDPQPVLTALLDFLAITPSQSLLDELSGRITCGNRRPRQHDVSIFAAEELACLEQLGYSPCWS